MNDSTSSILPAIDDAQASVGDIAGTRPCPKCRSDIAQLPGSAKFCPRCGADLQQQAGLFPQTPEPSVEAPASPVAPRVAADGPLRVLPLPSKEAARSPILRGFANALYRLGRRYEGGLGARFNPSEAQRCYFKAAKLGNRAAMARLNGAPTGPESDPG